MGIKHNFATKDCKIAKINRFDMNVDVFKG